MTKRNGKPMLFSAPLIGHPSEVVGKACAQSVDTHAKLFLAMSAEQRAALRAHPERRAEFFGTVPQPMKRQGIDFRNR